MSFNPENFYLKRLGDCEFKVHHRNVSFKKQTTTFGRSLDSDVALKNKRCSLKHCKIIFEDGKMFLEDVGSTAGTFINNRLIFKQKVELTENAIIGMGADPNRPDHVNQLKFYIYQVVKPQPAIELDSSDEETDTGPLSGIPIRSPIPNWHRVDDDEVMEVVDNENVENNDDESDSDHTVRLEVEEVEPNLDLTVKVDENLNVEVKSLLLNAKDQNKQEQPVVNENSAIKEAVEEPLTKNVEEDQQKSDTSSFKTANSTHEDDSVFSAPEDSEIKSNCSSSDSEVAKNLNSEPSAVDATSSKPESTKCPSEKSDSSKKSTNTARKSAFSTNIAKSSIQKLTESPKKAIKSNISEQTASMSSVQSISVPAPSTSVPITSTKSLKSSPIISKLRLVRRTSSSTTSSSNSLNASNSSSNEQSKGNLKRQSEELLEELENPRAQEKIIWRNGNALLAPNERKKRKKRGRPRKSESEKQENESDEAAQAVAVKLEEVENKNVENMEIDRKSTETISSTELPQDQHTEKLKSPSLESISSDSNLEPVPTNNEAFYSKTLKEVESKENEIKNSGAYVYQPDSEVLGSNINKKVVDPKIQDLKATESNTTASKPEALNIPKAPKSTSRSIPIRRESILKRRPPATSKDRSTKNRIEGSKYKESSSKSSSATSFAPQKGNSTSSKQNFGTKRNRDFDLSPKKRDSVPINQNFSLKRRNSVYKQHESSNSEPKLSEASKFTHKDSSTSSESNSNASTTKKMYKFPDEDSSSSTDVDNQQCQNIPSNNQQTPSTSSSYASKFPNIYNSANSVPKSIVEPEASTSTESPKLTLKQRRKSVFDEQAAILDKAKVCTVKEKTNTIRRWNQPTTKLIDDVPLVDPTKRKRTGRPKMTDEERLRKHIEKEKRKFE